MACVRLSHVCFSYSGAIDGLEDVTLELHQGWTGVVGENGGGKTTLLELIAGRLVPSAGVIGLQPADAVVYLCPQRVGAATPEIAGLGHLDLPSIERLEAALSEYPGALVLVSHDDAFARAVTSTVWRLDGQRLHVADPRDPAPESAT